MNQLTRRDFGKGIAITGLGAATLPLIGCQTQATKTLQLILDGAEALFPFIPGLSAAQAALVNTVINDLLTVTAQATTILASTESAEQKFLDISKAFATVALNSLPGKLSGAPAKALTIVSNIITAVSNFLKTIQSAPAAARGAGVKPELSKDDLKALPKIRARAEALKAKLSH